MSEPDEEHRPPQPPTTRWSLIVAAADHGGDPAAARQAMEELCELYWWPVLQYLVRKGYSLHDAQDLTQDFFARLSATSFLKQADPQKGRFRSLVFASLQHLLLDAGDRLRAMKRGGGAKHLTLDDWMEAELPANAADGFSVSQDSQQFDHAWAALVVRKALQRLSKEFSERGKSREFEVIRTFLTGGERGTAYVTAAESLKLPVGTMKAIVHRARARYGILLRGEVAQTVADPRDLEDEIRHLSQILAAQPGISLAAIG